MNFDKINKKKSKQKESSKTNEQFNTKSSFGQIFTNKTDIHNSRETFYQINTNKVVKSDEIGSKHEGHTSVTRNDTNVQSEEQKALTSKCKKLNLNLPKRIANSNEAISIQNNYKSKTTNEMDKHFILK